MNNRNDDHRGEEQEELFEIGIRIDSMPEETPGKSDFPAEKELLPDSGTGGVRTENELNTPSALDAIGRKLEQLFAEFEGKLKYDEHKNKVIDELHRELQAHREGLIQKHLHSFITDVIKVIDDIRKFKSHWENQPLTEEAPDNLLDFMDQIASDLEDLFSWQGICAFTSDQNTFDSTRQRIIKKIDTDDPEKNKLIAESLRPGYEWDGKVIRPEMVSVYVYNEALHTKGQAS